MNNKQIKFFGYVLIAQFVIALILICTYSLPMDVQGIINFFDISLIIAIVGLLVLVFTRSKNVNEVSLEK